MSPWVTSFLNLTTKFETYVYVLTLHFLPFMKDLVEHMVQRKPDLRLSAEEYLIKHRGKAFPEYFYTFFKTYSQQFATTPIMPSDDRILM